MFKALWFMIKVGVLVAAVVWVAERPGTVEFAWLDYHLKVQVGLFLLAALLIILFAIFIYSVIQTFVKLPASVRRYNEVKAREKGYKALTLGLTAVAAGDTKMALRQAKQASKLMAGDTGLPLLLQAQAARLDGREEDAQEHFVAMLENKEAAFLGVRGLLQAALDRKDYEKAMDLARTALKTHPKQGWLLKTVYDLELQNQDWSAARATLKKVLKAGGISPAQAKSDKVAMLMAEAEAEGSNDALKLLKKAQREDPGFVPCAVRLAEIYQEKGKRRPAMNVVKKTWAVNPHPILEEVWEALGRDGKMTPVKWRERLGDSLPSEERDKVWVCRETGRIAAEWIPVFDGRFNTLVWDMPRAMTGDTLSDPPRAVLDVPGR